MKDAVSIFYKKIETLIDLEDPHYNDLSKKHFGYKYYLVRNQIGGTVAEMIKPELIEKGKMALQAKEDRLRVPKTLDELKEI